MKPALMTARTLAADAAKRWMGTYGRTGNGYGKDKVDVLTALEALGPTPSPKAVNAVIGNKSWTEVPNCNGCGKKVRAVVLVGEEPDYESSSAHLCKRCVVAALAAFGDTP